MANLILASKREVKSGAQMWHVYLHENGAKVAESECYFSLPIKALKYAFLLRKRTGAIIPKAIYTKLMADVSASKAQAEPSALAKAWESMKAKHTAAKEIIHRYNGDEDAAWDLIMDDPEEGKYWRAKFAFMIQKKSIEDATALAGITVDEYMQHFHPDRTEY